MVASVLRSLGKDGQAARVESLNFKARIELITDYVVSNIDIEPKAASELRTWVSQADMARQRRNQLVHGRWSVDPYKRKAVNVIGLSSSEAQQTIEYTIDELEAIVQQFRQLNASLSRVRQRWHLP